MLYLELALEIDPCNASAYRNSAIAMHSIAQKMLDEGKANGRPLTKRVQESVNIYSQKGYFYMEEASRLRLTEVTQDQLDAYDKVIESERERAKKKADRRRKKLAAMGN